MPTRTELGREIEDALGYLSSQERGLSEVQQLIETVRKGGRVPVDVFDRALQAIAAEQRGAAAQLKKIRGELK